MTSKKKAGYTTTGTKVHYDLSLRLCAVRVVDGKEDVVLPIKDPVFRLTFEDPDDLTAALLGFEEILVVFEEFSSSESFNNDLTAMARIYATVLAHRLEPGAKD